MAHSAPTKAVSQFPLPPPSLYQPPLPPPPPPPATSYSMFGRVYATEDVLPTLEEAGRKCLYTPSAPAAQELRRLNASLLQIFMRLVSRLCEALPADAEETPHAELVQELEDTLINMQHLINVMRPAQAAMDVKTLLERQTRGRREMTERLKRSVKEAWELVGSAAEKLAEPSAQLSEEAERGVESEVFDRKTSVHETDVTMEDEEAEGDYPENKDSGDKRPTDPMPSLMAQITQIMHDPCL